VPDPPSYRLLQHFIWYAWHVSSRSSNRASSSDGFRLSDLAGRATTSVEEAASLLGIGRGLAYELARRGELPGVIRLGHRYVVSVQSLLGALGASETSFSTDRVDGGARSGKDADAPDTKNGSVL
jgi:excisionase family DNA binding protein